MNITHDNDIMFSTTISELRAISCILSGAFIVISDQNVYHDNEVVMQCVGDDFINQASMYLNQVGIHVDSFARISDTQIIFLTKNFDIKI